MLVEQRVGRARLFANVENVLNVRLTRMQHAFLEELSERDGTSTPLSAQARRCIDLAMRVFLNERAMADTKTRELLHKLADGTLDVDEFEHRLSALEREATH